MCSSDLDTPSERLRHWLSSGRDPVELTEQGWGVLMASLSAMTTQTGIDEDMPL